MVTLGCRLELENQRLQRELEAAKTQCLKTEKNSAYELEVETRRVTLEVSRLEEQGRRDQVRAEALKVTQAWFSGEAGVGGEGGSGGKERKGGVGDCGRDLEAAEQGPAD